MNAFRLTRQGGLFVAKKMSEAASSDDFGRMPLAAKMNGFQSEIGRYKRVISWRDTKNSAVVADTANDLSRAMWLGAFADAFDQRFFGEGHGPHYTKMAKVRFALS